MDSRFAADFTFNLCLLLLLLLGSIIKNICLAKTGSKPFGGFGGLNNASSFLESFLPYPDTTDEF